MAQLNTLAGPTINAGAVLSNVIDLGTLYIVGLVMPAEWTGAVVSVVVSQDGDNFYDLFDATGHEFLFNVTPGVAINVDPHRLLLARYLQLRSGTRKQPITQAKARTFRTIGTMQIAAAAGN